ncbi:MAG: M50 family metallopeptidase [Vulcanibacillus sp.]
MCALFTGQFIEIITLFAVVVIHELGHVFVAKSYGWEIKEIQLLPFGGMATMKQYNDSIWEEFIVALSGPIQNLFMVVVALSCMKFGLWSGEWTTFFINANLIIGLFNLLPISPLDGNKLLKCILFLFLPFRKAISYSIFISIVVNLFFIIWACGFIVIGKININGIILGVFFFLITISEIKQTTYTFWQFLFNKVDSKSKRNVSALSIIVNKDLLVISALKLLHRERYHLFYIISNDGEVLKIIPEEKLLQCIYKNNELYQPIFSIKS